MIRPGETPGDGFFVAGGTLRTDARSYVSRPADEELFEAALAGEFCYVLTPRQMGKSSLMVRTARRLQASDIRTVILDLTSIGTDVTAEQWYLGLLSRIATRLKSPVNVAHWWREREHFGIVQRFTECMRELLLQTDQRVVIFVDEIDTTLSLDFRDDFFAAIRYFYNMRSDEPELQRLSIVLLGVATPSELIHDRARTPFNIGRAIELHEFSRRDAEVLEQGLGDVFPDSGTDVFDRIYYWTNGHPYLTQKLCLAASEDVECAGTPERVDQLVDQLFLSEAARRETNLQFIRDNILADEPADRRRLLLLYRDVLRGKTVKEDKRSVAQNRAKLIGLVKAENGVLVVRNRIYSTVFDDKWIKDTIPPDWSRRVAVAAILALILMAAGVGYYVWRSQQQTTERLLQEQEALFLSGNPSVQLTSLALLYDRGDPQTISKADSLLDTLSSTERLAMLDATAAAGLEDSVWTVASALLPRLQNTSEDNALLDGMSGLLLASEGSDKVLLGNAIEQWLSGRTFAAEGDYQQALGDYTDALRLLQSYPCPSLYFDMATAYSASRDWPMALTYFSRAIDPFEYESELAILRIPLWQQRVADFVVAEPELMDIVFSDQTVVKAIETLLPTPTPVPSHTSLPAALATSVATARPIATEPSTVMPTIGASSAPEQGVPPPSRTPAIQASSTPRPTRSPTPRAVPTQTQAPQSSPTEVRISTSTSVPTVAPTFTPPPEPPATFTAPAPQVQPTFTAPAPAVLPTYTPPP